MGKHVETKSFNGRGIVSIVGVFDHSF